MVPSSPIVVLSGAASGTGGVGGGSGGAAIALLRASEAMLWEGNEVGLRKQ